MVRYKIVSVGSRRPYSSCRSFARRQAELSHYSEVGSREKKFRRTGPTFEHHAVRAAAIVSHFEFAPEGFNLAAAGADDLAFPRAPHSRCKLLVKPADFIRICTGCFQTGCFRTMGTSCALITSTKLPLPLPSASRYWQLCIKKSSSPMQTSPKSCPSNIQAFRSGSANLFRTPSERCLSAAT